MTDLVRAFQKLDCGSKRDHGCSAGNRMIAIDIDGNAYPCHRFVGDKGYCLGNIKNDIHRESFIGKAYMYGEKCSSCWLQNLCLGGCPYENKESTGEVNSPSSRNCHMMHVLYSELLKTYVQLTDEERERFLKAAK